MEFRNPRAAPPNNVIELRITPEDRGPWVAPPRAQHLWNSLSARMLGGLLLIALPFFIVAGLVPNFLARFGVGAEVIATLLLIAAIGAVARLSVRPLAALSHTAALVEAGDLSARVTPGGSAEMRHLGMTFNAMLERLSEMLFRLRGEVAESAASLSTTAVELATATQEQTTAATETASSMEELSRGTLSIAQTAAGVAAQAGEVRASMTLAQGELRVAGAGVEALARRVDEMSGILALIDDIADQTSLLALNAAIEAARAGEAGRGFAVVADEVRRLAERSKAAGAQISKLVASAQEQSAVTVTAVETRVRQLQLWLAMMATMGAASDQVQLATHKQQANVARAVVAIEQIAVSSRSVAGTARDISLAASRQGELAAELAWSGRERASLAPIREAGDGA
jgi:methyl-accepting chemotaxis protein